MKDAPALDWNAHESDLAAFLAKRDQALIDLDVAYVRKQLGRPEMTDEMALLTLHKSRYEVTSMPPHLRRASRAWLAERGYKRMTGDSLLPEGELPE